MFIKHLVWEPFQNKSLALFTFRLCQFLHVRTNGRFDLLVRRWIKPLRLKVRFPPSQLFPGSDARKVAAALREDGCAILDDRLPAQIVEEITAFAFSTPAYATDPASTIAITADSIPVEHPRYDWRIKDLIGNQTIQKILFDSYFHCVAQEYLGCRPRLSLIILWLNPPFKGENSQYVFHYDNDGPAFVKFFVYLSDVTEGNGPHVFIRKSHSPIKPGRFHECSRYEEPSLLEYFGAENKKTFVGPAGTMIAEDTMGFHRGSDVVKSYRLIFQLEYSVLDIPHAEEFGSGIQRLKVNGLEPSLQKVLAKYYC